MKQYSKQINLTILNDPEIFLECSVPLEYRETYTNNIKKLEINKKGKLKNKTFLFTGKLIDISRAEAKSLVEKNSGSVLSSVNKKLNYLVIGEKPTNKKIEQAKKIGIKIISKKDWNKLLN